MLLASFRPIKQLSIGNHRENCITVLHLAETCGYRWRPVLPQIDAHIGVEHITHGYRVPLQSFAALRLRILALPGKHVRWQLGEQIQNTNHVARFLSQNDFVATSENLNFRALDSKLFG